MMKTAIFETIASLSNDGDSKVSLHVLDTKRVSIRELFSDLGLTNEFRAVKEDGVWSDYGWTKSRKGKMLTFSMPVRPCYHSHDCCGCLISLEWQMTMHGQYLMLTEHRNYNC